MTEMTKCTRTLEVEALISVVEMLMSCIPSRDSKKLPYKASFSAVLETASPEASFEQLLSNSELFTYMIFWSASEGETVGWPLGVLVGTVDG